MLINSIKTIKASKTNIGTFFIDQSQFVPYTNNNLFTTKKTLKSILLTNFLFVVLDGYNPSGWEIRVGSHTDDLSNNVRPLHRWPLISSSAKLKKSFCLTSAFGGLIYLDSPKGNSTIRIKLENVIEAPFIDIAKPETISNWPNSAKAPGLWAELCGRVSLLEVYLI